MTETVTKISTKYEQLEQLLVSAKSVALAAEVHGFASGWIASGSNWTSATSSFYESFEVALSGELGTLLDEIASGVLTGLSDVDFGFQLLLPAEKIDINQRRSALSAWCMGFLTGFGLTGRFQDAELSDEVKELLKDFGQISQVEEEIPEDDDNDSDLTEITEYVRMGAIMCFTDCATKAVH